MDAKHVTNIYAWYRLSFILFNVVLKYLKISLDAHL